MIPRERVRDLYSQPYAARYPVICRDEQPQPRRVDKRPPQPARPGRPATCTLWMFVEPLGPWRTAKALADHPRYRQAERLILVCDHLNTHAYASFYRAFPPAEARRLA